GTQESDEQIVQWDSAPCKLLLLTEDRRADQASDPLGHRLVGARRRRGLVLGLKIEQHIRRSWLGGLECDGRLLGWCQSGDWLVPPRRGVNRKLVPPRRIRFGTCQHGDRDDHFLWRQSAVVSVLLDSIPHPFAPGRDQSVGLGEDPVAMDLELI